MRAQDGPAFAHATDSFAECAFRDAMSSNFLEITSSKGSGAVHAARVGSGRCLNKQQATINPDTISVAGIKTSTTRMRAR
jgi:hypothetical protein